MLDDELMAPAGDGEWECDECGHIVVGRADMPPGGSCSGCGEPAADGFTFFSYDEDEDEDGADDDWDDDGEDE